MLLWEPEHRFGWYRIDLALPLERIAIELDGVYWHSLENVKRRDVQKSTYLAKHGWTLRRIPIEAHHRDAPEVLADLITGAVSSARLEQRKKDRVVV